MAVIGCLIDICLRIIIQVENMSFVEVLRTVYTEGDRVGGMIPHVTWAHLIHEAHARPTHRPDLTRLGMRFKDNMIEHKGIGRYMYVFLARLSCC